MLVPDKYIEVFDPLCQEAPTTAWKDVKAIVEEDLGRPIHEVYSRFEQTAVASASLAQVHEAVLRETGERVAVKVQH